MQFLTFDTKPDQAAVVSGQTRNWWFGIQIGSGAETFCIKDMKAKKTHFLKQLPLKNKRQKLLQLPSKLDNMG